MKTKHILVVSQIFYPEQTRAIDICKEWMKRGYKVTVLTGIPNYPVGKFYKGYNWFHKRKESYEKVEIIRIPIIPRGNNFIQLSFNYLSFVFSGFFWSKFTRTKVDSIFVYAVSPITQALPGLWFAKRRKIPCYLYVLDLWPENVQMITGISKGRFIDILKKLVRYIYKHCDRIFISSKAFRQSIMSHNVPFEKIEFWPQYAEDFYGKLSSEEVSIKEIPQDGKTNIIFAGNIGYAQGLEILPEVAEILKGKTVPVRFNIIGDGRYKPELIEEVEKKGVADMFNFISQRPASEISSFMAVCDGALITLGKSEVLSNTIPAKLQSCLSCGIPIIASADGEVQRIVKEAEAGMCSDASDVTVLASNIEKFIKLGDNDKTIMAENALKYSNKHFNKEKLFEQIDKHFEL